MIGLVVEGEGLEVVIITEKFEEMVIHDLQGVEPGGVPSGDLYIVYNNEQLDTAQESGLGLYMHGLQISAIGQADDCVLLSYDLSCMKNLLELTLDYCKKYPVMLAHEKTKLLAFSTPKHQSDIGYLQLVNNIQISGMPISQSPLQLQLSMSEYLDLLITAIFPMSLIKYPTTRALSLEYFQLNLPGDTTPTLLLP